MGSLVKTGALSGEPLEGGTADSRFFFVLPRGRPTGDSGNAIVDGTRIPITEGLPPVHDGETPLVATFIADSEVNGFGRGFCG